MGKEPNTVKTNLVSKLLDISEQDPNIEFEQSDFQKDLNFTVLVRERPRGSKLQSIFEKKSGKTIKETGHTITMLPKNSSKPKIYAKRDLAHLSKEQKAVIEKSAKEKRQRGEWSSSESSQERPMGKKSQKSKKSAAVAKGSTPTLAIEFNNEEEERPPAVEIERPPIVDITSSTKGDQIKNSSGALKLEKRRKRGLSKTPKKDESSLQLQPDGKPRKSRRVIPQPE